MDTRAEREARIQKGRERYFKAVEGLPSAAQGKMGRSTFRRIHSSSGFWIFAAGAPMSKLVTKEIAMREKQLAAIERLPRMYPSIAKKYPAEQYLNRRDAWKNKIV